MATLTGKTIASTYDQIVKRQDSYSATGNQIEIMDDSGVIKTTPLYLDSVNSRVGIGTTSPGELLEVNGTAQINTRLRVGYGTVSNPHIGETDDTNTGIWWASSDTIALVTGASERMRITSAGNVGIGTTSPDASLDITGSASSKYALRAINSSSQGWGAYIKGGADSADTSLHVVDKDAASLLMVRGNGYVGIGTDSPVSNLDVTDASGGVLSLSKDDTVVYTGNVFGKIQATGNDSSWSGSTIAGSIQIKADGTQSDTHPKSYMSFLTADGSSAETEQMRIDSSGNVGIGTTAPAATLDIRGDDLFIGNAATDASSRIMFVEKADDRTQGFSMIYAGTTNPTLSGQAFTATANTFNIIRHNNSAAGATALTINRTDGNVGIGDTSPSYQLELSTNSAAKPTSTLWTVPSDERLKDDIVLADLDKCYDIIQNLPLKRFKWKEDVYTNDQTDDRSVLGWIAQDVQSVFPKSVKENNFRGVSNNDAIQSIEAQDAVEWLDKPSEDNTKDEIKAWMDTNSLAYNSGDTKTDLIAKIPELKQEAIESVVGVDETYKLEIEDCLSIDADQIFRAMFGAIQKLQAKVEALESK